MTSVLQILVITDYTLFSVQFSVAIGLLSTVAGLGKRPREFNLATNFIDFYLSTPGYQRAPLKTNILYKSLAE